MCRWRLNSTDLLFPCSVQTHSLTHTLTVPVTAGYSSEEVPFFPIMWPYDRPATLKRTHAALDPYPLMDYYSHLQVPAPKYMKPEPITYYQYGGPEDPERYQANITVSVQSHVHPFSSTSTSAIAYSPSTQYSSYSSSPIPATLPTTTTYPVNPGSSSSSSVAAVAVGGAAYSVHHAGAAAMCGGGGGGSSMAICCQPDPQQAMSSCSPIRSAMGDDSSRPNEQHCATIGTPLTPPLSVSPPISSSPTPRQSISPQPSNTYLEKDAATAAAMGGYRSSTSSPCIPDCDSTTNASQLPLQMLSELSEGLPLTAVTGACV